MDGGKPPYRAEARNSDAGPISSEVIKAAISHLNAALDAKGQPDRRPESHPINLVSTEH